MLNSCSHWKSHHERSQQNNECYAIKEWREEGLISQLKYTEEKTANRPIFLHFACPFISGDEQSLTMAHQGRGQGRGSGRGRGGQRGGRAARGRGHGPPRSAAVCWTYFLEKKEDDIVTSNTPLNISFLFVTYMIYQEETCPDTGLRHLQGYAEFRKPMRLPKQVEDLVFYGERTMHIELRRGTQNEAIDYCRKEDSRVVGGKRLVYGTPRRVHQGMRTDLAEMLVSLQDELQQGRNPLTTVGLGEHRDTVAKHFQYFLFSVNSLNADMHRSKQREIEVVALFGNTGVGKSKRVWELVHRQQFYKLDSSMATKGGQCWFQGYCAEKILWIDEAIQNIHPLLVLNLLDRYPLQVAVKGSQAWAAWELVFITSNYPCAEWFGLEVPQATRDAIQRRVNVEQYVPYLGSLDNWVPALSHSSMHILGLLGDPESVHQTAPHPPVSELDTGAAFVYEENNEEIMRDETDVGI